MNRFSYSLSPSAHITLQTIELLRRDILTTPLSPETEIRLRFEATVSRIQGIVILGGIDKTKQEVVHQLTASPAKQPEASPVIALKKTLFAIALDWTARPAPVSPDDLNAIASALGETTRIGNTLVALLEGHRADLKQMLSFLETSRDHPIVVALVAFLETMAIAPLGEKSAQLALCMLFLYLHKYGYDVRGMVSVLPAWTDDMSAFTNAIMKAEKFGDFSPFLDFGIRNMAAELAMLKKVMTEKLQVSTASFATLSDRQKDILLLLEHPEAALTNRVVQQRFQISQITASRELAKLSALGLLAPHGKGRSVAYTRV